MQHWQLELSCLEAQLRRNFARRALTTAQVRARGVCVALSDEEADAYFRSRPRSSQIGAWVSQQSSVLGSREELDDAAEELRHYYGEVKEVPRPPHWGGWRLVPNEIEFWQGYIPPPVLHSALCPPMHVLSMTHHLALLMPQIDRLMSPCPVFPTSIC